MSKKWAYYNEHDAYAAQWIRNLIAAGHVAPGEVDERSIEDVHPLDVRGFVQCHWFAGIAVWSAALRASGWGDDRPIWTGSCPCQPFSQAGKGAGLADERHLWPAFLWLIQHGKSPEVPVLGEQVASPDGLAWLDIVRSDMEAQAYSFRAVDLCSAGVGAPHIRQRIFFVADRLEHPIGPRLEGHHGDEHHGDEHHGDQPGWLGAGTAGPVAEAGGAGRLGNADSGRAGRHAGALRGAQAGEGGGRCNHDAHPPSDPSGLAIADGRELRGRSIADGGNDGDRTNSGRQEGDGGPASGSTTIGLGHPGHGEHQRRDTLRAADGEHERAPGQGEGGGAERIGPEHDPAVHGAGNGLEHAESGGAATAELGGQQRGVELPGEGNGLEHAPSGGRGEFGDESGEGSGGHVDGAEQHGGLGDSNGEQRNWGGPGGPGGRNEPTNGGGAGAEWTGPTNGFWASADWLFCKDGKWRPAKPGSQCLADGTAGRMVVRRTVGVGQEAREEEYWYNRVGALRGFGNAINKEAATAFIKAVMGE